MRQTLVTCQHCGGGGKAALDLVLERTLGCMPRNKWMSTDEVRTTLADPYVKQETAINNRLTRLKELGCVVSERRGGKLLFWKRVK